MAELANCPRCGAVFVQMMRPICQSCYQAEEKDFQTVYTFLKSHKNREASLQEIAASTEVDESIIIKFIREKRLRTSEFPALGYPCERCGTSIQTGHICANCSDELKRELKHHEQVEAISSTSKKQEKQPIYYTMDQFKQ